jgi:hypothetical protein
MIIEKVMNFQEICGNLDYLLQLNNKDFKERVKELELDWLPSFMLVSKNRTVYRFLYRVVQNQDISMQLVISILTTFKQTSIINVLKPKLDQSLQSLLKRTCKGKYTLTLLDFQFLRHVYSIIEFDPMILMAPYVSASKEAKLEVLALFYTYFTSHPFKIELLEFHGSTFLKDLSLIMDYAIIFGKGDWESDVCALLDEKLLKSGNVGIEIDGQLKQFARELREKSGSVKELNQVTVTDDLKIDSNENIMKILEINDIFPDLGHGFIEVIVILN